MPTPRWLQPELVLLDVEATDLAAAMPPAAEAIARVSGKDARNLAARLVAELGESDFGIGLGVAIPHVELADLEQTQVAILRLARPTLIRSGEKVDLIFVVAARAGAPVAHLRLLAEIAGLLRSRALRDGIRAATSASEVVELLKAASARLAPPLAEAAVAADDYLAFVSIAGEAAIDAMLLALVDFGIDQASIVDAQTLHEAASREVPLFAGFRDIFGDPGGQRLVMTPISADRVPELQRLVASVCEQHRAISGSVAFVPVTARWTWKRNPEEGTQGH